MLQRRTHERGAGGDFGPRVEFDIDELGHTIDGQDYVCFALG